MRSDPAVLGDIGGTNVRFALALRNEITPITSLNVADYATAADALAAFLKSLPGDLRPRAAVLACAGPVEDNVVSLTNSPWRVDAGEIERLFGMERVLLVNDFAAVAHALPHLDTGNLCAVGGGTAKVGRPSVVLGPGTGLGLAAYLPPPQGPAAIVGEGGHATMPAADDREAEVLARLRAGLGHVSAERVVSGDGLVRLYETIAAIDDVAAPQRTAAGITDAGTAGSCTVSRAALDMFCAMLGTVAGNTALTLGAQGGVYIAGGIVPRIADYFVASDFRRRFEAKGRFRPYLSAIPSWVVLHPEPALLGLSSLLDDRDQTAPRSSA